MIDAAFEERMARLDEWEACVADAVNALEEVLLDPELGTYEPRRKALRDALDWLEMEITCGDCREGRCHFGGERSRQSIAAVKAGEEYEDPEFGACGCARHEASVEARARRIRLDKIHGEGQGRGD